MIETFNRVILAGRMVGEMSWSRSGGRTVGRFVLSVAERFMGRQQRMVEIEINVPVVLSAAVAARPQAKMIYDGAGVLIEGRIWPDRANGNAISILASDLKLNIGD